MRASFLNAFYDSSETSASELKSSGTCLDLIGCRRLFDTKKSIIIRYRDVLNFAIPRSGLLTAHILQHGVTQGP